MIDVILDTLLDTVKLLPFLYLAYLLMEYLEHKAGNAPKNWLKKSGKVGPVIGGAFGIVPQCGFSASATSLYAGRIISGGTLIAVYLSTSDEMLPILISKGADFGFIVKVLLTKLIIAIIAGFLVDFVHRILSKNKISEEPSIEDICEREHCHCESHFALSALRHTLLITAFILVFSFILNTLIFVIGEDTIKNIMTNNSLLSIIISSLIGLIPNCASSVIITDLYIENIIPIGSLLSGLLVNAGIGLAILFRNNRPIKDSLKIVLILLFVGIASGIIINYTPLYNIY